MENEQQKLLYRGTKNYLYRMHSKGVRVIADLQKGFNESCTQISRAVEESKFVKKNQILQIVGHCQLKSKLIYKCAQIVTLQNLLLIQKVYNTYQVYFKLVRIL